MKKAVILVASAFLLNSCTWAQTPKLNESIIQSIQNNIPNISIGSYAFCIPEFLFAMKDSLFLTKFIEYKSGRMTFLESYKDVYLSELMEIQFLKDSLNVYYSKHEDNKQEIKRILDFFEKMPEYNLQKNDCFLFFESYTSESGVGAMKIETLLITQNLSLVFDYIKNNKRAKERFLEWIEEEIEVWCPSFATGDPGNTELRKRIVNFLYNRLHNQNDIMAQQAANKMKSWFGL